VHFMVYYRMSQYWQLIYKKEISNGNRRETTIIICRFPVFLWVWREDEKLTH
jgi:hypothetical protein